MKERKRGGKKNSSRSSNNNIGNDKWNTLHT